MKAHWENPWSDAVVVPIEELIECDASLGKSCNDGKISFILTKERLLQYYTQYTSKVDAYILPSGKEFCMGIRYGLQGNEYLSPLGDQKKLAKLYERYTCYCCGDSGICFLGTRGCIRDHRGVVK